MSNEYFDNKVIKKPSDVEPLTEEQQKEFIRCGLDFHYWARNYAWVQGPTGECLFDPRPYQSRIIEKIENNNHVIVTAGRQSGKDLALDTIIPTPCGYKTMGEMKPGDKVYGSDGKIINVVAVSEVFTNHDCFEIEFSTGEKIVAGGGHEWILNHEDSRPKRGREVKLNTYNLYDIEQSQGMIHPKKPGERHKKQARYSVKSIEQVEGIHADLPIDPYIFGYWLGDGTTNGGSITVHKSDFADGIESKLGELGIPYRIRNETRKEKENIYTVYPENLSNDLTNLLESKKANDDKGMQRKRIPTEYLRASKEQRIQLVQGIMDSDGTSDPAGRMELTFKYKSLLEDFRELLASLGVRTGEPRDKYVPYCDTTYYRVSFSIYLTDFEAFRLKRKLQRQAKAPHPFRVRSTKKRQIISIRKVDTVPTKCIQVDSDDHLYAVTRAFILTHNSQLAVTYALHQMIFNKNFKVGITSYTLTPNLKDLATRMRFLIENTPWWLRPGIVQYNQYGIRFVNGSSVTFQVTKPNTFRGLTLNLVVSDELSHVKSDISEEFYNSLLPSIMAAGEDSTTKLLLISTPNGTTGTYSRIWADAVNGANTFAYDEVKYEEIPGRTPEFEKSMLKTMSKNKFLQEFKCAWISDKGTLINSSKLESMVPVEPIEVINEDLWLWVDNLKGKKIALACDVSDGIGKDFHAVQIVDIDTLSQIGEFRNNLMTQTQYATEIVKMMKLLFDMGASDIYYTVENNGTGSGVINLLTNMSNPVIDRAHLVSDPDAKKLGLRMSSSTKPEGCGKLKDLVESDRFHIRSERLITELKFFVKSGISFKAESGMHDDLCMSMVLMMLLLQEVSEFEESAYETFNELDIDIEQEGYEVGIYF